MPGVVLIIPLSDDRRIVGTEHCWELQRRKLVNGEERWRTHKYFHELGSAVQEAAHAEIRLDPAVSLSEALETIDRVVRRYEDLLDNALGEVAERANQATRAS